VRGRERGREGGGGGVTPANIKEIFEEGQDCAVTLEGVAEMFLVGGNQERYEGGREGGREVGLALAL